MESIVATSIGLVGTVLFTVLLVLGIISEATYAILLGGTALVALVIHGFSRLKELDLRNLKLTLNEIKQVQKELNDTKADIVEMYGGIEKLRREPMVLNEEKMKALGLKGTGVVLASAVMRYKAGCTKRERERLARIFINGKSPEEIAVAIVDNSLDDHVFKWSGPKTPLGEIPRPVRESKGLNSLTDE